MPIQPSANLSPSNFRLVISSVLFVMSFSRTVNMQ